MNNKKDKNSEWVRLHLSFHKMGYLTDFSYSDNDKHTSIKGPDIYGEWTLYSTGNGTRNIPSFTAHGKALELVESLIKNADNHIVLELHVGGKEKHFYTK